MAEKTLENLINELLSLDNQIDVMLSQAEEEVTKLENDLQEKSVNRLKNKEPRDSVKKDSF